MNINWDFGGIGQFLLGVAALIVALRDIVRRKGGKNVRDH